MTLSYGAQSRTERGLWVRLGSIDDLCVAGKGGIQCWCVSRRAGIGTENVPGSMGSIGMVARLAVVWTL